MREMQIELEKKNKELKETQKMLIHSERLAVAGQLVAGIIHEIRTPLTGIMGYHQLLKMKLTDQTLLDYLDHCVNAVDKIKNIVSNMLNFAKKGDELVSVVDISNVFRSMEGLINILSKQENLKIEIKPLNGSLSVRGNSSQIEQVIMALVNNAIHAVKSTKKSKFENPPIAISAAKDSNTNEVIIQVKDEGTGIPETIKEKIFDPFYTTKPIEEGTGLGLSICKTIVESFNGKILLSSEFNKGTVFTLCFPEVSKSSSGNRKK